MRRLLVIVVDDAAERQRQVGQKMMGAHHSPDRKVRDRRIDMRDQMEATRADPRSLDDDIGQIDRGYERIERRLQALGAQIERV